MRVTRIDIQVGSLSVIAIERTCIKGRRWHEYPLTERNYWRAVGLQLRLAGFADDAGENPLDKKNYREEE